MSNYTPAQYQRQRKKWDERSARWKTSHPEAWQRIQLRSALKKYGITIEQYEMLLNQQGGVCAICNRRDISERLHVDHNHLTGQVRGLLCRRCNRTIGLLDDDPDIVNRMVKYLQ